MLVAVMFSYSFEYTLPNGWDWLRDVLIPNLDCLCAGLEVLELLSASLLTTLCFQLSGDCRVPWGVKELPRQNLAPSPYPCQPQVSSPTLQGHPG